MTYPARDVRVRPSTGFPPPGRPKSPRKTEILRTPIQGQKRILDPLCGMFDFLDSLPLAGTANPPAPRKRV